MAPINVFQYSVGDAVLQRGEERLNFVSHFQYSVGDAVAKPVRRDFSQSGLSFQYSVGDAGGSCLWFLWVFKFLCRRVWVSAAAC